MEKARRAGFLIKQISEQTDKRVNNGLKKYNVTSSQFRTMMLIDMENTVMSQRNLELVMNVSHPTVVGILAGLEGRGLVKCAFDAEDKRIKNVYLTEDGKKLLKGTRASAKEMDETLFEGISEEDIDALLNTLEKIRENLKK